MALLLDLTHIRGAPHHVERSWPGTEFEAPEDEFRVATAVALVLDIERQDRQFRLVGSIRAALELRCSRCLEPMPWPVDMEFDLLYLPMSANAGADEREVASEDLGVGFYQGDTMDLGELVREQFHLSLPMKPLCRPDCAGLCPECGSNLNVTVCDCERRWVDPRMAALQQVLRKSTEH